MHCIPIKNISEAEISCTNCRAYCCRLEVMLISDTGVPEKHIAVDQWGAETMRRLADGWCSAVDRETFMCTIYANRHGFVASLQWAPLSAVTSGRRCKLNRADRAFTASFLSAATRNQLIYPQFKSCLSLAHRLSAF